MPAVPIKKSIGTDYLICLEDGKKLKTLKRHLASRYHLTPDQYRQRWGLPKDYPMVAPAYAAAALGPGQADRPRPQARAGGPRPAKPAAAAAKPIRRAAGRKKKAA